MKNLIARPLGSWKIGYNRELSGKVCDEIDANKGAREQNTIVISSVLDAIGPRD
jgi:hypothetical protein